MHNPNDKLEYYLAVSRDVRGAAAADLCVKATTDPHLHVFSELLSTAGISELANDPVHASAHRLLKLFAYGTYAQWSAHPESYPSLSKEQLAKLRILSLVSVAAGRSCLPYSDLMFALGMTATRELEEFVLEAGYSGLVTVRLDQRAERVLVLSVVGRDVDTDGGNIETMKNTLQVWRANCQRLLKAIDGQIAFVSSETQRTRRAQLQNEEIQRSVRNIVHRADSLGLSSFQSRTPQDGLLDFMESDRSRQALVHGSRDRRSMGPHASLPRFEM